MGNLLDSKNIVLGVTGSIACYKAAQLASNLVQSGAIVNVIMTESATRFVSPLTFRSITHNPVVTDIFDLHSEHAVEHVSLARQADLLLIAPATANFIAKLANGMSDDSLSITALATTAPIIVAPAMDANMFHNPAFQSNLSTILKRGFKVVGPNEGYLSSGEIGKGRMSEPQEILGHISWVLGQKGDLEGRSIVISAGGTHEPIDPVRILTNRSSGKMGYAIAEAARDRGANVTLVSASTNIPPPVGVRIRVANTVEEMKREILGSCAFADAVIMAAAISDFRVSHFEPNKIKRKKPKEKIQLLLEENEDFSNQIPKNVIRIGFAAETENLIENAKRKLTEKNLAFIVANDVTIPNSGFEADTNQVTIIDSYGSINPLPLISKFEVGHHILDKLHSLLNPGDRKS